jgi:hypothetical protein
MGVPQQFTISLGGETYNLKIVWNNIGQEWIMDINDSSNNPIVAGIALVTGIGLLRQYGYLDIAGGGDFFVQTANDPDAPLTYASFGSNGYLYFTTDFGQI